MAGIRFLSCCRTFRVLARDLACEIYPHLVGAATMEIGRNVIGIEGLESLECRHARTKQRNEAASPRDNHRNGDKRTQRTQRVGDPKASLRSSRSFAANSSCV